MINFITANPSHAKSVVTAQVRQNFSEGEGITSFEGFSTLYKDSTSSRHLSYHHVTLHSLKERTRYEYRVRVEASLNTSASQWSDWIDFKTLYSSGETRFAIYADMGAFASQFAKPSVPAMSRQHVGNLVDDLAMGKIDFAVHSGDLAYEFEVYGGARGDGFMDGYSQFLSHAPWVPGWGNHEYLEEDRGNRLANITAGLIAEKNRLNPRVSRMHYSVDIGLVHILQLDMSPYWCHFSGCISVDTCGFPDEWVKNASDTHNPDVRYDFEGYREDMLAYVRADLEAVNRTQTPWVIVTGHYPLYETYDDFDAKNMASERSGVDGRARGRGGQASSSAPVPSKAQALADFEPLLREFSVDIFFAGHDHNYETTWPVYNFSVVQKSYNNPKATVHIVSGSAGPPEWDAFVAEAPDWSRHPRLQVNSYSRMTVWNGSVLAFEQVANDNGTVVDSFAIKKGI